MSWKFARMMKQKAKESRTPHPIRSLAYEKTFGKVSACVEVLLGRRGKLELLPPAQGKSTAFQ